MNIGILMDAADGDAAFARELADLFRAQIAEQLVLLRAAMAAGSASTVQSIAHHCKGSSHTCGAVTLASLFGELSRVAEAGQLEQAPRLVADIEREFVRAEAAYEKLPLAAGAHVKKILIVDDDAVITAVYEKHFRNDGFEVRVAHTGEAGLDAVRTFLPDAVLLDLNMPGVNGVQWLDEIRKDARFARLPVTVFTAGEIGWQFWAANNLDVTFIFKDGAVPKNIVKAINAALAAGPLPVAA